ncbi:unnamed protein product [Urochloa humidicola]
MEKERNLLGLTTLSSPYISRTLMKNYEEQTIMRMLPLPSCHDISIYVYVLISGGFYVTTTFKREQQEVMLHMRLGHASWITKNIAGVDFVMDASPLDNKVRYIWDECK